MPQWKENESGLLVPATPYTYGAKQPGLSRLRSVLGEKYLLAKRRRQVTPGVRKVPNATDLSPWDLQNLEEHVIGRGEESVKVLLGAAFLRKAGLVDRDELVSYQGAEFQRGKGSKLYPAAHRFPCNPTIRSWGLPHYAKSRRLERALERPLEKTDYLPKLVNYADRLFEANGACDAVAKTIRFVLHEQPTDKDINLNMIRHATTSELLQGYKRAYEKALVLAEANTKGIDLLDASALEYVNDAWFSSSTGAGSKKAEESIDVVRFSLLHSIRVANSHGEPITLAPTAMTEYVARLEALHKAR
jgi:hypothetical protein